MRRLFKFTGVKKGLLKLVGRPSKVKQRKVVNLRKMSRLELIEYVQKLIREKATK